MPQRQRETTHPIPRPISNPDVLQRPAIQPGRSPQASTTEASHIPHQQIASFHPNLSQILPHSPTASPAQRQPNAAPPNFKIASPKPSDHGYQEIAAVSGAGQHPVGSVKIKGSAAQGKLEVASLWVNPEHRQQGISKTLISAATQTGRQQGYHKAALGVDPEAPGMSTQTLKNIYARQGFKPKGQDSQGHPLMEKDL